MNERQVSAFPCAPIYGAYVGGYGNRTISAAFRPMAIPAIGEMSWDIQILTPPFTIGALGMLDRLLDLNDR